MSAPRGADPIGPDTAPPLCKTGRMKTHAMSAVAEAMTTALELEMIQGVQDTRWKAITAKVGVPKPWSPATAEELEASTAVPGPGPRSVLFLPDRILKKIDFDGPGGCWIWKAEKHSAPTVGWLYFPSAMAQ